MENYDHILKRHGKEREERIAFDGLCSVPGMEY